MNRLLHRHLSTMSKGFSGLRRAVGWVLTDHDGEIQTASLEVQRFYGVRRVARGYDFFRLFPEHEKAVRCDMTAALTGWPAARQIVVDTMSAQPVAVRYLISRRISAGLGSGGLFWHLEFEELGGDAQD